MPHITAELFATLDGTVSAPQHWHGPFWDPAMGQRTEQLLAAADVMLLGRNTYLEHADYWPTDTSAMGDLMNGIAKIVVSTTLSSPQWQNTTIVDDGLAAAHEHLGGRNVVVTGSVAMIKSLLRLGLLDELRLIVDPVVVDNGIRLFTESLKNPLRLVESVPYPTGAVSLHYAIEAGADPEASQR
jgi:dihydrofolate reductase